MTPKIPVRKSIGVRIFILILAVVVPLAGFGFYNSSKEKQRWTQEISRDLNGATREAANKISDLIDSSEDLLTALVATEVITGGNLFTCTRVLHNVAKQFPKYTNFSVVNADKFIVCSSGALPKPKNVSASPNIIQAFKTKAFAISSFKFGVLTGKPVLVFSMPVFSHDREVVGTVNNGLSLTWLSDYLPSLSHVEGQRMVVFDGHGRVMAGHPQAQFEIGSSVFETALGRAVIGKTTGAVQFIAEDGQAMLAAISTIPRVPGGAYIVAFAPLDPLLVETRDDLFLHLTLLLGLAGVSLFVGWAGVRVLVLDPIDKLTALAGKVADGDLSARSDIAYNTGDLGTLALAYDRMIEALDARTSALRESEAHYRELVESEEQLIHRFLPDTTEVFVNQALADFFGGKVDEWVGQKWIDHVSVEEREAVLDVLGKCTPDHPANVFEHMARNADGQERWLRWNNRAFFDDQGRVTHYQAVALDLTDRKKIEHNLELAMMDARAANLAKSNFLANMSHELRTPLNSIIGFSEMMSSGVMGKLPEKYEEYSNFISSSGHHLLNIINDILDLSKIEAGMLKLDEEEVHLEREVMEVLAMLEDLAFKNDNELHNKLGDGAFTVMADRMRIKQVLLNIVSNAVKFTQGGQIIVTAINNDGAVGVTVSDSGIGMTQREIEIALRSFGQVDGQHLNKRYEGTGLGLPLAEQLMEMHGGKLVIDSTPGEGTSITLQFPSERTVKT